MTEFPRDVSVCKRWRSVWHKWYEGLDLSDDLDPHADVSLDDDVFEAVLEEEDNNAA